jgi:YbbR domain-containing protein
MRMIRYLFSGMSRLIGYQIGLKILSILIAISLWVVVFGSRTIEITKDVPFEVQMSDDQILVDPVPEKITFRLTGPKAFLRTLSTRLEDPIRANIRNLKTGIFTHRIYSDSIKLPLGVKVQSINPNVIQLRVEELKHKMVSVKVETMGDVAPNYKVVRTEVLPAQMKIRGPKNRLSTLNILSTMPIDLSGLRETAIIPLSFDFKSLGVEPDSSMPELSVEVIGKGQAFRVKHVPLKIRTTGTAKADDEEVMVIVRTDPSDGGKDPVKIDGDSVKAEIDVRDLPVGEYMKWIRVQLPEKVHLVRVIPPLTRVTVKNRE